MIYSNKLFIYFTLTMLNAVCLSAQIRVVCVGNSITEGVGATSSAEAYPAQLGLLLGSEYEVLNCGVSARTMLKKGDYPYWNETKFVTAKNYNPDIVIISLGTNDSKNANWVYKSEFYTDYVAMVNEFRKNGKTPQIFVCSPPPSFSDNYSIRNAVIRDEIIPLVDSVASTQKTARIDYFHPLLPFGELFGDGIHPNNQGASLMAKIAYHAIKGTAMPSIFGRDYTDEAIITSEQSYSDLSALTDNDENTLFKINPQGTAIINFEFPQKMNLNGCLFYLGDSAFNAINWEVQYSTDKTIWTTSARTECNPQNKGYVFALATSPAKYFRLKIIGNTPLSINEFQLFGFPKINEKPSTQYPDDLTGKTMDDATGTLTADDAGLTAFNEIAVNAIDGIQNKYTVNGYKIGLTYTFKNPTIAGSYSLGVGSKGNLGRNPKNWKLLAAGSDLQYHVIAEERFFSFPHIDYCNMKFDIAEPAAYVSYRIEIDGAGGENLTHLSEWQLFTERLVSSVQTPKDLSNVLVAIHTQNNQLILNNLTLSDCSYEIINLSGNTVKHGILTDSQILKMEAGLYVVRVLSGKETQLQKVIVK